MTDDLQPPNRDCVPTSRVALSTRDIVAWLLGILVFLAGVVALGYVFVLACQVYDSIDTRMAQAGVTTTARPAVAKLKAPQAEQDLQPVKARPEGQSVGVVAGVLGLHLLGLLVLGGLAALVAGRGAALAGAHQGRRA